MTASPVAAQMDVRENLIEAAERCFSRYGLAKTTMADVAKEANVHRATVYRYFTDRRDLVTAVFVKESLPLIARAARRLARCTDVAEGLVAALVNANEELRRSERLQILFDRESAADTAQLAWMSQEMVELARKATEPALERAREEGLLRPGVQVDDACGWLLRVAMSFNAESPPPLAREQARLLRTFVIPALFRTDTK